MKILSILTVSAVFLLQSHEISACQSEDVSSSEGFSPPEMTICTKPSTITKEVAEFSSGKCSNLASYERIRVTDTLKLESFYDIKCLLKKVDLQLVKRLDIRFEDSLPEDLKNDFKNLLAKLNEDAAIKLISEQSMLYPHGESHEVLSGSSGTWAYHELLKYLSSLKKKIHIDLDCIFYYRFHSKQGQLSINYAIGQDPSEFGRIFEGLDLPQVRSLRTLERVSEVAKLENIIPNLEHVSFPILRFDEKDVKDLNQLTAFKNLKSIEIYLPSDELNPEAYDCSNLFDDLAFLKEVVMRSAGFNERILGSCKTKAKFKLHLKGYGPSLSSLVEKLNEASFKGPIVVDPKTLIKPQKFPNLNITVDEEGSAVSAEESDGNVDGVVGGEFEKESDKKSDKESDKESEEESAESTEESEKESDKKSEKESDKNPNKKSVVEKNGSSLSRSDLSSSSTRADDSITQSSGNRQGKNDKDNADNGALRTVVFSILPLAMLIISLDADFFHS